LRRTVSGSCHLAERACRAILKPGLSGSIGKP
jgi:hypothetical protein